MAIRRFREHAARQDWFAITIDVGIVVLGVFLGIQASNWNEGRIERGEARTYRAQIVEDLKANEEELAERIRYYRQVRVHALAAMTALADGAPLGEPFLVDTYQATQVSPIRMERAAYNELISGGLAKSFGDSAVRRRLSSYYAGTDRLEAASIYSTGYRDRVRREMRYTVQQHLRERCSDVIALSPAGLEEVMLPARCDLQLPSALASRAAIDLGRTPELEQELTRHIADLDVKIGRFQQWLLMARNTRQVLESLRMS